MSQGLLHQTNCSFTQLGHLIRLPEDKELFKEGLLQCKEASLTILFT